MSHDTPYVSWEVTAETLYDEDGEEYSGEDYALICKVYVPVEQRGQGIARRMMEGTIAEIQTAHPGMDIMLVCEPQDSETDSEKLAEFYHSLGFSDYLDGAPGQMKL